MKRDPYSSLGLDQALFKDADKSTSNQAIKPASLSASKSTNKPADRPHGREAGSEVSSQGTIQSRLPAHLTGRNEAIRPPAAASRGQSSVRMTGRFTYDIFRDQARWMSRLKIDLEEIYGSKLMINSMVALAVDIMINDYEINGEQSQVIRVLVKGLPAQTTRRALKEAPGG